MSLIDSPDFTIRYSNLNDTVYLRNWLKLPGMLHWFPPSDDQELENFIQIWMSFSRFSASLTAILKQEPIGIATLFLMPYRKVAHHCMIQMIVDPNYQRKGVGGSLLKNLKHLAKNYFHLELIHVEVFEGNPIISLLKACEFREFARQEDYVKENDKYLARILMEYDLTNLENG